MNILANETMDGEPEETPRSACYRCHSQKLRCVQIRGRKDCVRCSRAGGECVTRPSKRIRQGKASAMRKEKVSPEALSACDSNLGELFTYGKVGPTGELKHEKDHRCILIPGLAHAYDLNGFDSIPSDECLDVDHHLQLPTVENFDSVIGSTEPSLSGMDFIENQSAALNTAPLPMELVQEWNNQQDSAQDSGGDRSYQSNSEEGQESDWIGALFSLNAKLDQNQRATMKFIETCQKGFVNFEASQSKPKFQLNSGWEFTTAQPTCPFERIFDLSMQLLLLIDKASRPMIRTDGANNSLTQFDPFPANGRIDQADSEPLVYLGDKANLFLLLSCYTRLLGSFCSVFECFHWILTSNEDQNSPDRAVRYIHSFLPRIQMGDVTLCVNPRFDLAMVLNSAENTLNELNKSIQKAFVEKRLDRPDRPFPKGIDCLIEQPGGSPSSDQGGLSEVAHSWQTTIQDVSSPVLKMIDALKEVI